MTARETIPPPFERSEWEFWEGLRGTSRGLGRLLQQEFRRARITPPQYWALHCLKVHGPVHAGKLSRWLDVTLPTVSGVVDHLERLGYVARHPASEDRRRVMLELTPRGARLIQRLDRDQARFARELADLLPPRDRVTVTRALRRLSERLTPEHGPCDNCGHPDGAS